MFVCYFLLRNFCFCCCRVEWGMGNSFDRRSRVHSRCQRTWRKSWWETENFYERFRSELPSEIFGQHSGGNTFQWRGYCWSYQNYYYYGTKKCLYNNKKHLFLDLNMFWKIWVNLYFLLQSKASGKKLQRISLSTSLRGIRITDLSKNEDIHQISLYRYKKLVMF